MGNKTYRQWRPSTPLSALGRQVSQHSHEKPWNMCDARQPGSVIGSPQKTRPLAHTPHAPLGGTPSVHHLQHRPVPR